MILLSSLGSLSWEDTHVGLGAAVERGPSQGARSGSTEPTWVSSHPFTARVQRMLVHLVYLVYLVQSKNRTDETDRTDQTDQNDQTDELGRVARAQETV